MSSFLLLDHPSGIPRLLEPTALSWWQSNAFPGRVEEQWGSWDLPYRHWISSAIGSASSVYEIGCGVGANLRRIQHDHPGVKLGGSDGSPDYCEIARQRLGLDIDETVLPAPVPMGWDTVLINYVLSYLRPEDAQATLAGVRAPRVIVSEPSPSPTNPQGVVFEGGLDHRNKFVCPQWCHPWYEWCWDLGWRPVSGAQFTGGRLNLGMVYDTGYRPGGVKE